jgi:excisionase family DNA binding protein
MPCPDPWLSVAACADECGVSRYTAWRWLKAGIGGRRLKATRMGGAWRVRRSDLAAFVEVMTAAATAGASAPVVDAAATPAAQKARAKAAGDALAAAGW